jgi:hypothetical protein
METRIGLTVHTPDAGSTIYALVCASAVRSAGANRDSFLLCLVPGRRVIALVLRTRVWRPAALVRRDRQLASA